MCVKSAWSKEFDQQTRSALCFQPRTGRQPPCKVRSGAGHTVSHRVDARAAGSLSIFVSSNTHQQGIYFIDMKMYGMKCSSALSHAKYRTQTEWLRLFLRLSLRNICRLAEVINVHKKVLKVSQSKSEIIHLDVQSDFLRIHYQIFLFFLYLRSTIRVRRKEECALPFPVCVTSSGVIHSSLQTISRVKTFSPSCPDKPDLAPWILFFLLTKYRDLFVTVHFEIRIGTVICTDYFQNSDSETFTAAKGLL